MKVVQMLATGILLAAACCDIQYEAQAVAVRSQMRASFGSTSCPAGSYLKKQDMLADYCVTCEGCGLYTDSRGNQTECKRATIESCPDGSVPKYVQGASSLAQACQPVQTGSFYQEAKVAGSACYVVSHCVGLALYTNKTGETKCQDFSSTCKAEGLEPRFVYSGSQAAVEALCIEKNAPGYATHSDGLLRVCAGCGSYFENGQCKTATRATCPQGTVPVVSVGATTLAEACETLPSADFGYNEEQCALLPCTSKTSIPADSFHPTCEDSLKGLSLSTVSTCNDIVTTKSYAKGRIATLKFLAVSGFGAVPDPICQDAKLLAVNPQCSCPVVTTPKPTSTVSPTLSPTESVGSQQVENHQQDIGSPTHLATGSGHNGVARSSAADFAVVAILCWLSLYLMPC